MSAQDAVPTRRRFKKRHSFTATVVVWNLDYCSPFSSKQRRQAILDRIFRDHDPDVVCLTKANFELLADQPGDTIYSQPDGIVAKDETSSKRKVVLWSREPWEQIDDQGLDTLQAGRFVSGVTRTPLGRVTVMGTCIPYEGSRTRWTNDGIKRRNWEDHEQYLESLSRVLRQASPTGLVLLGDFNQRVGEIGRAPRELREKLGAVLSPHMTIATGALGFDGRRVIEHIAMSEDMSAQSVTLIGNFHDDQQITSRAGVVADLASRSAPAMNPTEYHAFERFTDVPVMERTTRDDD